MPTATERSRTRAVLAHGPFRLLLTARTVSMLAMALAPVALAFGVLDLPGATAGTLSTVLAGEALTLVLFTLAGGVIADRFPRGRVLRVSEWTNALCHAALGVMLVTGHAPIWGLTAVAAVAGIANALVWPALTGIIPDVVPETELQEGNALVSMGGNVARITGLVAGGFVVVAIGPGWSLLLSGLAFAVAGVLVGALPLPAPAERQDDGLWRDLRDGWREFSSRQWLWVVVVQFSVIVLVWQAAHFVLGPVVAKAELGGPRAWTIVLTGESLGLIVGGLIGLRYRPRRPILAATLMSLFGAPPYLLLGLHAPLWAVALGSFGMGLTFNLFGIIWSTTMQREVPPEALSRVSSYDALGSLMLGPIGLVLAGPVTAAFGAHRALVGAGVVMLLMTLFALCFPEVRNLRARPDDAPTPVVEPTTAGPEPVLPS